MEKKDILKLKKITSARISDCQEALENSNGDFEKAILWLRKKGQKIAAKRVNKTTDQGSVFAQTNSDNNFGVMLVLGCETDFVARNNLFVVLGKELLNIALENKCTSLEELLKLPASHSTVQELITHTSATLGENIVISHYTSLSDALVGTYIHTGGRIGAIVSLNNTFPDASSLDLGKNIAMQVVASDPVAINKEDIPESILLTEKMLAEEAIKKQNRPKDIAEKIMKNKMEKVINEITLLPQPFIKDNEKSVEQYLNSISPDLKISGFKRFLITA